MCNLISLYKRRVQVQLQRERPRSEGGRERCEQMYKKKLKVGICCGVRKGAATPSIRERTVQQQQQPRMSPSAIK